MTELRMGIYRHYKGPLYQVIGLAHDANADTLTVANDAHHWDEDNYRSIPLGERTVVVYFPLQLDGAHLGPRMAVRTLEDFTAVLDTDPRENSGLTSEPRFEYLGPELTAGML